MFKFEKCHAVTPSRVVRTGKKTPTQCIQNSALCRRNPKRAALSDIAARCPKADIKVRIYALVCFCDRTSRIAAILFPGKLIKCQQDNPLYGVVACLVGDLSLWGRNHGIYEAIDGEVASCSQEDWRVHLSSGVVVEMIDCLNCVRPVRHENACYYRGYWTCASCGRWHRP